MPSAPPFTCQWPETGVRADSGQGPGVDGRVDPCAAVERVVACAAVEGVVAARPVEHVAPAVAGDDVGEPVAGDVDVAATEQRDAEDTRAQRQGDPVAPAGAVTVRLFARGGRGPRGACGAPTWMVSPAPAVSTARWKLGAVCAGAGREEAVGRDIDVAGLQHDRAVAARCPRIQDLVGRPSSWASGRQNSTVSKVLLPGWEPDRSSSVP